MDLSTRLLNHSLTPTFMGERNHLISCSLQILPRQLTAVVISKAELMKTLSTHLISCSLEILRCNFKFNFSKLIRIRSKIGNEIEIKIEIKIKIEIEIHKNIEICLRVYDYAFDRKFFYRSSQKKSKRTSFPINQSNNQ